MSKARQIANLLADLDDVATSGQYADLAGNPSAVSTFTNDSGYITAAALPTNVSELSNDSSYATTTQVAAAVSDLVDAAPAALDTLNELAAALGDDADYAASTATAIGLKANQSQVTSIASTQSTDGGRITVLEAQYRATAEHTATAGQTALTISGLSAQPSDLEVFMNGIRLASSDYSSTYASNVSTVTLGEAAVVGDVFELVAWKI